MQPSQNFHCLKQLGLSFDNSSPQAMIWQWNELSPHVREVILEMSGFSTKAIVIIAKQKAKEVEPWIKCTLNWIMELVSKGWVDLRFNEK
ncbi:hypothetical protein [Candidatus Parabeggiatoa sp. HSG14]|uniref:hypothetical protein n=1 Tax=Candidatus Parabeggiatoa sp. HSG14 TaxID=3055593 RepID=UPI0025A83F2D|nr:hypothetical protein [Thiotrichales bacterium HSG14]MDM8560254.1 hypothetical protein [Thiotrichales bacterium HSG14]